MKAPKTPTTSRRPRTSGKQTSVRRNSSADEKLSGLPGQVVQIDGALEIEEIRREPADAEPQTTMVGLRVVDAAPAQEAEEIVSDSGPDRKNHPRLSNGARIRENRSYQRVQKINPKKLIVPANDEMGYKKLFTKFEEGFLAQDIAMIGECLSPAFQWRLPNGDVVYGKKEALEEMERRFATPNGPKFSKAIWRFEGETVLQSYEVEYLGPDGRWRQSKGFDIYEIGNGLITLKDAYWKMIP